MVPCHDSHMTTTVWFSVVADFLTRMFWAAHLKAADRWDPESRVVAVVANGQVVRFS